jgi:hypothetical protein
MNSLANEFFQTMEKGARDYQTQHADEFELISWLRIEMRQRGRNLHKENEMQLEELTIGRPFRVSHNCRGAGWT